MLGTGKLFEQSHTEKMLCVICKDKHQTIETKVRTIDDVHVATRVLGMETRVAMVREGSGNFVKGLMSGNPVKQTCIHDCLFILPCFLRHLLLLLINMD